MTPRTKEQNEEIRHRRMVQIMRAAAATYVQKGINMEMRDVAAKAELGYGTVYHYYKNKYDLMNDLMKQGLEEADELGIRYLSQEGASIKEYCTALLRRWGKDPTLFVLYKLACEQFRELPEPAAGERIEGFRQNVIGPLTEVLKPEYAARPEQTAWLIVGGLVGCAGLSVYGQALEIHEHEIVKLLLASIEMRGAVQL